MRIIGRACVRTYIHGRAGASGASRRTRATDKGHEPCGYTRNAMSRFSPPMCRKPIAVLLERSGEENEIEKGRERNEWRKINVEKYNTEFIVTMKRRKENRQARKIE